MKNANIKHDAGGKFRPSWSHVWDDVHRKSHFCMHVLASCIEN
jgi:hypothetical protein